MARKRNSGSENIETVRESDGCGRRSNPVLAGRAPASAPDLAGQEQTAAPEKANESLQARADRLAVLNEQLLLEREQLQTRIFEMLELKNRAERRAFGMQRLARLGEENPDPALRVLPDGRIQYKNPASLQLCSEWNEEDSLRVPPVIQEIVAAAYARTETIRREVPLGERTYLVTAASTSRLANYVNVFVRDITEQKRAEEDLKVKDNAITSSLNAIAMADLQGRLTYVNPAFLTLWRYEDEHKVLGKSVLDFWAEPQRAVEIMQTIRNEGGWEGELVAVTKDGTHRNLYLSATTVPNENGVPTCTMASFMDITERKRAEEALRERMKELACLYAVSRDTQEALSLDELCRRAVEHLIPAMQFPDITVPVIELDGKRFAPKSYAEGLSYGLHAQIRARGETLGHLRVYYAQERPFVTPEEQNLVNGVAEALSTWLERKRAEQLLRESEARLSLALDSGQTGLWEWDVRTNQSVWNAKEYQVLGLPVGDGREPTERFFQRVHPDDLPVLQQSLAAVMREGSDWRAECRILYPDGQMRWLAAVGRVFRDADGRVQRVIGLNYDITDTKEAEERLRQWSATLEQRVAARTVELEHRTRQLQKLTLEMSEAEERERKRMAEILHDDLQQILAAAKFQLSVMRNRLKDDASLQTLALEMDRMLKEAVEKSRSLSYELSPVGLRHGDFIETLQWLAGQMQSRYGLTVQVHTNGKVDLRSDTIAAFLYRTAQELLFNVVKHARVDKAEIGVRRRSPWVCLSISDRGRGFDPQELQQAAGYGLLSIRERIELLGGRMKIKSAKGRGSTFFIAVPEGQAQGPASQAETRLTGPSAVGPRAAGEANGRIRVLLADDHRIVREGLRLLLSDQPDVEIVGEAAHGREAVDLALRLEPDVVIMDVSMPLIDGDAATRMIREHLSKTRVVALSTYAEPETIQRMYRAGAESYVLKTASPEELLAAIRGTEHKPESSRPTR